MPNYIYHAKDKDGRTVSGSEFYQNEHHLAEALRMRGLSLVSASVNPLYKKSRMPLGRVSVMDRLMFTRNMRVMLGAGMPLARILDVLSAQTHSAKFAVVIRSVSDKLRQGMSLGDSFGGYPNVFDELYVNMLKTGEQGSNLENVLSALEEQLRRDYELRSHIKGAMIYPLVILSSLFAVGGLIVFFVMPRLAKAFEGLGVKMPFILKMFIGLNGVLKNYWPFIIAAAVMIGLALRFIVRSKKYKALKNELILKMPIFGNISRQINTARFLRTLSSLIIGGVPIHNALLITANTLSNHLFAESLRKTAAQVQRGGPLNQALDRDLWAPVVVEMTVVGEETGKLSDVLMQLASFYEEEVSNTVKNISALIEPLLMIVIGVAIGVFAISVIQPIYSIVQSF